MTGGKSAAATRTTCTSPAYNPRQDTKSDSPKYTPRAARFGAANAAAAAATINDTTSYNAESKRTNPSQEGTGMQSHSPVANIRAQKAGIGAEAEAKCLGKYDPQLSRELLEWIARTAHLSINTDGSMENFVATLRDGVVLCKLANSIRPGAVKFSEGSKLAFKQMENIQNYLSFTEDTLGIRKDESFVTCDLFEAQNPYSVQCAVAALKRKVTKR